MVATSGARTGIARTAAGRRGAVGDLARGMLWTDMLVVFIAVAIAHVARFGGGALATYLGAEPTDGSGLLINYVGVSLVLTVLWVLSLHAFGTREASILGGGTLEYKRVLDATMGVFGLVAIMAVVARYDIARGYIAIALPIGLAMLIVSRAVWRSWLRERRRRGHFVAATVLVGSEDSVAAIAADLGRDPAAGYLVTGVYVPGGVEGTMLGELAVLGDARTVRSLEAEYVIVTSADALPPQRVRELSWALRPGEQHLIVAPALTDVGGPRLHSRPVAGLPLVHVEMPTFAGTKRVAKRAFDIVAASLLLVLLAIPMLVVALVIKISSPGPVLFKQTRIGLDGTEFDMLKYRSMVVDAEARLQTLLDLQQDAGNEVLFKMQDDPRITPIGKVIRRYSVDELPQIVNVLLGSMSLVGPRPPLAREVAQYEDHVHRRFIVKPGITGLWQVSGRSTLSWEESVRIDLSYVENWSLAGDLHILLRTFRVVVARQGAF